ncbi:MAG: selenium-dependent xanthine dehydrogenase [Deltaproteobacteria bacterium]|nr:selenium-dependent xanthine dehydrogenase [Deltaproteobacteria bacterium]
MHEVTFELNGRPVCVRVAAGETLLHTLRERLAIRSVKDGCAPQGQCGCCLVVVDDHPKTTCLLQTDRVAGHRILTLEGVTDRERTALSTCLAYCAGVQCGFCTPGIALRAVSFVRHHPTPVRADLAKALDGNLCRCTGYHKVFEAVELYAQVLRGEVELPRLPTDGRVGQSLPNLSAVRAALGERPFVADLDRPGLLHGALVLSAHPRALVAGIDTTAARALPGVQAVATWRDVPGDRLQGLLYPDWPILVAEGEEVRCVGDVLAAVAAVDEATARRAADLVQVTYQPLPPVLDPFAALAPGAPRVNPVHDNLLSHTVLRRGDAEAALRQSAHVVGGRWQTQRIEHLFLEPEACLAEPTTHGMRVFSQGQGIFDDQRAIAAMLGWPLDRVHVEQVASGGSFGGKEDLSVQAQTALLCALTREPVRLVLTRAQSVRMHPKRHPITLDYEVGCDAQGQLTAVRARMVGDSGAYASVGGKVLERAAGHACGPYRVPVVDIEARAAYTNHPPCGAMRGFGVCQAAFAIEACVDLLAERVGLDRWTMRDRNALQVGDRYSTGQVLTKSVGLRQTLRALRPHWDAAVAAGRAVGIACGLKNSGLGNGAVEFGRARLVVEVDGTVSLYNGFSEMGQGLLTALVQCAVEVTGLPAAVFRPRVDTTFALGCGQTTGSRGTLLSGRAVQAAAEKLAAALQGCSLGLLAGQVFSGEVRIDDTTAPGADVAEPKTHTSFGFATQLVELDDQGRLLRVVAAHDVGRALNPAAVVGQIQGAVVMGLGYALTESLDCDNGAPVTHKLRELGALRSRDVPPVEVLLVEDPEPEGPFGAKGVGEIGLVPTAAAVAGALRAFDGRLRTVLPMRDCPAARALSVGHHPPHRPGSGP